MDQFLGGDAALSNADLLEKIGLLSWLNDHDSELLGKITTARVGYEVYRRMSSDAEMDALRNQTILKIAKYVKDNPKASKAEIQKELARQIVNFARQVDKL